MPNVQNFTIFGAKKIKPTLLLETKLWNQGYQYVAGIDEVGRGAWAGPLVAAAVILPQNFKVPRNLADSKLLKHKNRVILAKIIKKIAISISIIEISSTRIDKINIANATNTAFKKAVKTLTPVPDFCLIDAFYIKRFARKYQHAIKNGDKLCASIAAASIIAKVYRDNLMRKLHFSYPLYGFGKHKGYGTRQHQEAIKQHGFTNIHRTSYNLSYLIS